MKVVVENDLAFRKTVSKVVFQSLTIRYIVKIPNQLLME